MATEIWKQCNGTHHVRLLDEKAWRLVEAQERTSTRKLVDSAAEQAILEEMIEESKPPITKEYANLHPLLHTPFRYPPLKHGSRFGKKTEPSLWYGSLELSTAMAEKAFYQLNFLRASVAEYGIVEQPLTAFSTSIKTMRGIKLLASPFSAYTSIISSPVSYEKGQTLGANMREANIHAFTYQSARDPQQGVNIALFTPKAFLHKKPDTASFQSWQCFANNQSVEFTRTSSIFFEERHFLLEQFIVDGELPFPAN